MDSKKQVYVFDNLYASGKGVGALSCAKPRKLAKSKAFKNLNASGELRVVSVEKIKDLGAFAFLKFSKVQKEV